MSNPWREIVDRKMTLLYESLPVQDPSFLYALQDVGLVSRDEREHLLSLTTKQEKLNSLIEGMRVKGEPLDSFSRFMGVLKSNFNWKYLAMQLEGTSNLVTQTGIATPQIPSTADQHHVPYPICETQPHDSPHLPCSCPSRPENCQLNSTAAHPLAPFDWSQYTVNDDVIRIVSTHAACRREAFCRSLLGRKIAADIASELTTKDTRRSSDKLDIILNSWMETNCTHKLVDIKIGCERPDVAVWGIVKTKLSEMYRGIQEDVWLLRDVTSETIDVMKQHACHRWLQIGCALLHCTISQVQDLVGESNVPNSVHVTYALQEWMKREERPTVDKILSVCDRPDVGIRGIVEKELRELYCKKLFDS